MTDSLAKAIVGASHNRINIEIPDEVHARLKVIATAEGKGFYERLKEDLTASCPDERTLLEMPRDIGKDREEPR